MLPHAMKQIRDGKRHEGGVSGHRQGQNTTPSRVNGPSGTPSRPHGSGDINEVFGHTVEPEGQANQLAFTPGADDPHRKKSR